MRTLEDSEVIAVSVNDRGSVVTIGVTDTEQTALVKVHNETEVIKVKSKAVAPSSMDIYQGVYNVTPSAYAQELQTANKMLERNVVVNEIPYYETHNANGITVYIGE